MTDFTGFDSFFDFDAASDPSPVNEVNSGRSEPVNNLFTYPARFPDQYHQAESIQSTQPIQQAHQMAVIADPFPAMAPLPATVLQQQWPSLTPRTQNMGTVHFTYTEATATRQPILQQQDPTTAQANIQRRQPAPAPARQSTGPIRNNDGRPPAHCRHHTRLFELGIPPRSRDLNMRSHPRIQQQTSNPSLSLIQQQPASLSQNVFPHHHNLAPANPLPQGSPRPRIDAARQPIQHMPSHRPAIQQQHIPSPPNVLLYPHPLAPANPLPQGSPRPRIDAARQPIQHIPLTQPGIPQYHYQPGTPTLTPTQQQQQQQQPPPRPAPLTTQQLQASSPLLTPPKTPSPTKSSRRQSPKTPPPSSGSTSNRVTKKSAGRKPKDHDKTGFVTDREAPENHFNTVKYGRNNLRCEARLAEEYNQVSYVKKGKGKEKVNESQSAGEERGKVDESQSAESGNEHEEGKEKEKEQEVVAVDTTPHETTSPSSENREEATEAVNGDVSVEAEMERETGTMEYDENMLDFDLGEVDMDALFGSVDGKSYFLFD